MIKYLKPFSSFVATKKQGPKSESPVVSVVVHEFQLEKVRTGIDIAQPEESGD
jgi:hypothetical protein